MGEEGLLVDHRPHIHCWVKAGADLEVFGRRHDVIDPVLGLP